MSPSTATFIPTRNPAPALPVVKQSRESRAATFMIAAALLDYPGQEWDEILTEVRSALAQLPAEAAAEFSQFLDWAGERSRREVEEAYVETFDQKRRCCLELTYYAPGDTRQRGIALTIVRDLYAAVGWQLDNDQLPDYLPNILELAARTEGEEHELVESMLASHREGIEILHAALLSLSSPWAHVVAALRMALPEVDEATFARMQTLVRQGPPSEMVGMADRGDLPWPTVQTPSSLVSPAGENEL